MRTPDDNRVRRIGSIVTDLLAKDETEKDNTMSAAILAYGIVRQTGYENMDVEGLDDIVRLCLRILSVMPLSDDPRFSMDDYADAYANANIDINLKKLLDLDDECFAAAMTWLAMDKHETYFDLPHAQGPIEVDIAND